MAAKHDITTFLSQPSFAEGMSRTLDLGGTLRRDDDGGTIGDADYRAILNDWIVTGNDLSNSIDSYGKRIGRSSTR